MSLVPAIIRFQVQFLVFKCTNLSFSSHCTLFSGKMSGQPSEPQQGQVPQDLGHYTDAFELVR